MLEQIAINLLTMVLGVTLGTYLGAKIMKHELTKEISHYIMNELPHVLESEQFKVKARRMAHSAIRELWNIILEELQGQSQHGG
jgi:ketopantoate reductase